jgi:hypothetical protein
MLVWPLLVLLRTSRPAVPNIVWERDRNWQQTAARQKALCSHGTILLAVQLCLQPRYKLSKVVKVSALVYSQSPKLEKVTVRRYF